MERLAEIEQTATNTVYSPAKLFTDLRNGIFRELESKPVDIDLYRRNLQRWYVEQLAADIKNPAANSDLPAFARSELETIRKLIRRTGFTGAKTSVQMHLKDLAARITRGLEPHGTPEQ